MPQVCSEKLSLKRKLWLQERMGSLEVVPRINQISINEYYSVHQWIKYHFDKPKKCFACQQVKLLDWACIGKYEKDIKNFKALCRRCHIRLDKFGNFTHCLAGHVMTKENTYSYPNRGRNAGCTRCKTCSTISKEIYNSAKCQSKNPDCNCTKKYKTKEHKSYVPSVRNLNQQVS